MERRHIREGFHTVTPYLSVRDAPALIAFIDAVFAAEERRREPPCSRRKSAAAISARMGRS